MAPVTDCTNNYIELYIVSTIARTRASKFFAEVGNGAAILAKHSANAHL